MSPSPVLSLPIAAACLLIACDADRGGPSGSAASASSSAATAASSSRSPTPAATADPERPDTCAPCHAAVVNEWKESMHARAHHSLDPIYAGVRAARAKKEGEAVTKACAGCHTPRDLADAESAKSKTGVSCATCHQVAQVKPGAKGVAAFEATTGNLMLGPHDIVEGKSAAHATGPAPAHMTNSDALCNACHGELSTPGGVTMCATGVEHREGGEGKRCVTCHMPEERGPSGSAVARSSHRSHRFVGPHRAYYQRDPEFLEGAVAMTAEREGDVVAVTLENSSEHGFPTGFPGRMAEVVVRGTAGGKVTYRSAGTVEEAMLRKVYVDEDGKPTLAPWAKELKVDSRLEPGEKRAITFQLPPGIETVEVELIFRLLPPKLARKLGLDKRIEARATTIARAKLGGDG